jgi:hypothetical protein
MKTIILGLMVLGFLHSTLAIDKADLDSRICNWPGASPTKK